MKGSRKVPESERAKNKGVKQAGKTRNKGLVERRKGILGTKHLVGKEIVGREV